MVLLSLKETVVKIKKLVFIQKVKKHKHKRLRLHSILEWSLFIIRASEVNYMFIDEAKVYVKAGDGGDGIVAFRRVKYVREGGPACGDGGKGGEVIIEVKEGLSSGM